MEGTYATVTLWTQMVGDFSPNALLHTDLYSIRHNEYYVKSRKQGSNLRPEIYKIPALSLSYSGISGGDQVPDLRNLGFNKEEPNISSPSNSPSWARSNNLSVNSTLLHQLSYRGMVLCLRIELSVQVCCPPVLTNRLPEVKIGDELQERIHGFEPRIKVWKTLVLPLHHTRI